MKVIKLRPVKESTADFDRIEARIKAVYRKYFYGPLLKELSLPQNTIQNATEGLIKALQTGRITYSDGAFRGRFDATTTVELKDLGATWDKKTSTFKLDNLPYEIRSAITTGHMRYQERVSRINKKLEEIKPPDIASHLKTADLFSSTLNKTDKEIKKTVKDLRVYPELSAEETAKIADEWQNNMELWINNFTEEEIKRLRADIQKSVLSGNRYESLIDTLQRSYGVTTRKAKFLARQETSLMMAKFKETRYTKLGIDEYEWRTVAGSANHPVRESHKILDGKIFTWSNPPITTAPDQPVRRNNPGQDYNCRCMAVPIVRFK